MEHTVTICIPVYQGEGFVEETLLSAINQDYPNTRIIVSVDQASEEIQAILEPFSLYDRTDIYYHAGHLGWAGNFNFLLDQIESRYFFILPHDDILEPSYTRTLVNLLINNPNAIAAFSDISTFGEKNGTISQPSIIGTQLDRIIDYLEHHYNAVHLRAVVDKDRLSGNIQFGDNDQFSFAEDTIWGLRLAIQGDMLQHPECLYHKRYHRDSLHRKWSYFSPHQMVDNWVRHCLTCLKVLQEYSVFEANREILTDAVLHRLLQDKHNIWRKKVIQQNSSPFQLLNRILEQVI